jgi:lipoyl-dependent peroxiredoxin
MKVLHTAVVTSRGGRQGHVESSDGVLSLDLARPSVGGGTNPEQLFAAGYAACFEGAFRLAARNKEVSLGEVAITVHVTLNMTDETTFDLSVDIHGEAEGLSPAQLMELMEAAHAICPYSRAVRGNVAVQLFAV